MSKKIGFSFFSAFLDLQSIRDNETTTSKKLIFLCSDYIITSRKTRVEVANSVKTMTFYEMSELFRKYPKTPVFDHSNYRLFERIHAVPGTSNNRGLTVLYSYSWFPTEIQKHNSMISMTFNAWLPTSPFSSIFTMLR